MGTSIFLLLFCLIIFLSILLNQVSSHFGIPVLLAFIGLGMAFGSDGIWKINFTDYDFASNFCTIALVFVIFYGGFCTNWQVAKKIALVSSLLASVGVFITAAVLGVFCYYVLNFPLIESFLVGALISSTDAATVFSILKTNKLSLKYNTDSMIEFESGSNDPCSYMMTILILSFMKTPMNFESIGVMLLQQVGFAFLFAFIITKLAFYYIKRTEKSAEDFDMVFVFAIALVAYALPDYFGGNGYLSTYIVGIALGNAKLKNKKGISNFFNGLTSLMQICIFFLLGLLSSPSKLPQVFENSMFIMLFLTFVARVLTVFVIMTPFKAPIRQQLLVSWAGLRGAASIVFAILAVSSGIQFKEDIFHMVFMIVILSILCQGTFLPFMSKLLKMYDAKGNIMQIFSDYSDERQIQFAEMKITKEHPWKDKKLLEVFLPKEFLAVAVLRKGKVLIPRGYTKIHENDLLIISMPAYHGDIPINVSEISLAEHTEYIGKKIKQLDFKENELVAMIKREDMQIIPRGDTLLLPNDIIVKVKS